MKEYKLNKEESLTVMDMVQDAIDRGMIAEHYDTDLIEHIIGNLTNDFGSYNVEFEISIKVIG